MDKDTAIGKFRNFVACEGETLGRLLFWAEKRILEATQGRMAANGDRLTLAQISLMQQLCLGSTRLTDLAGRMGMTKQAVGQIVDDLERRGLVRRTADPRDSRAKVIAYSEQGYAVVDRLIDATLATERELAGEIGDKDLATLKAILTRMSAAER